MNKGDFGIWVSVGEKGASVKKEAQLEGESLFGIHFRSIYPKYFMNLARLQPWLSDIQL